MGSSILSISTETVIAFHRLRPCSVEKRFAGVFQRLGIRSDKAAIKVQFFSPAPMTCMPNGQAVVCKTISIGSTPIQASLSV